jgi:hypothetical protein
VVQRSVPTSVNHKRPLCQGKRRGEGGLGVGGWPETPPASTPRQGVRRVRLGSGHRRQDEAAGAFPRHAGLQLPGRQDRRGPVFLRRAGPGLGQGAPSRDRREVAGRRPPLEAGAVDVGGAGVAVPLARLDGRRPRRGVDSRSPAAPASPSPSRSPRPCPQQPTPSPVSRSEPGAGLPDLANPRQQPGDRTPPGAVGTHPRFTPSRAMSRSPPAEPPLTTPGPDNPDEPAIVPARSVPGS